MTTTSSFFGLTILLISILSCALAAHVPRAVSPIITEPTARAIWILGSVQTVEWCVITDGLDLDGVEGTVLLGYAHTDGNVTLWKDQPLAENVSLADGVVNVRCPLNLPTTLRYVVALLGDENNISPVFTIEDPSNPVPTNGSVSYPAALQTAGNVPSATLTHTSVVATIPPASSTPSASSESSESVSSSGTSVQASTTGKPSPSESSNGALVRSVPNSDLLSIIIGLPVLASGLLL
ncbi:hypothetical protein GY45DRAFT_1305905 [Cubamyces sp. BRFM 1775]|nr:hypothetical protein GY45DRAFT_1305905 [Cubamyces sp. BRFM 1775]